MTQVGHSSKAPHHNPEVSRSLWMKREEQQPNHRDEDEDESSFSKVERDTAIFLKTSRGFHVSQFSSNLNVGAKLLGDLILAPAGPPVL
jgi:hypothetical protein